jgi:hypothetical protein
VRTDVYQVIPVAGETAEKLKAGQLVREGSREADWPPIDSRSGAAPSQIEPGEHDEFGFDFLIPGDAKSLSIYSYVRNESLEDREFGWTVTSLYDLDYPRAEQRERAESMPARTQS